MDNAKEIKGKSFGDAMPYTITTGFYFLFYIPFLVVCLPIYGIGFFGTWIADAEDD